MGKIMDLLAGGLGWLLESIFQFTNNYGLSIILATIVVRLLLYPLTISQTKSMMAMKKLQPEMDALQKKYKDNKEEYNKKVMELYQKHKINPLGGCLPVLLQFPILIALYRVLSTLPLAEAATFLGMSLDLPNQIAAVVAAGTTYFQSRLTATDTSQKAMMIVPPLMIGFFSMGLKAGVVLYWITSNVFSIVQQMFLNKMYPMETQGGQK